MWFGARRHCKAFTRLGRTLNKKFVLILGAGASIGSGVKPTKAIVQELVGSFARGDVKSIEERFDMLWTPAGPDQRMGSLISIRNRRQIIGFLPV